MKFCEIPEEMQIIAADTLSQMIIRNLYDEEKTIEYSQFLAKAFIGLYQSEYVEP